MTEQNESDGHLVEVVINVDNHTHAGKPREKGDKIRVTPAQKKWLQDNKVIK